MEEHFREWYENPSRTDTLACIPMCRTYGGRCLQDVLSQVSATYGTRVHAALGAPSDFQWHAEATSFTYQFCCDSRRSYIDLKRMFLAH